MAFQVSPGVNVTEFDLTTIIPAPAGPTGAIVGEFPWGPIEVAQPIENELKLAERFGKPAVSGNAAASFFTAANYLSYASSAVVVRAVTSTAKNAVANSSAGTAAAPLIKNSDVYSAAYIEAASTVANAVLAARYAGDLGNNIKVSMFANTNAAAFSSWEYATFFDRAPGTSYYLAQNYTSNANDEVYIVVVDETGVLSGQANSVLERFTASKATNARDENNNSLYYRDVLFNKSRWVYWVGHPAAGTNWGTAANSTTVYTQTAGSGDGIVDFTFTGGVTGTAVAANVQAAMDILREPTVDVSFICVGPYTDSAQYAMQVAEDRKDCLAFISPPLANVQAADPAVSIAGYRSSINYNSSYGVMDSGWKYQYDKYNDVYRYSPLSGDMAGLCARTDATRDPWFSPAGQVRGQIRNIVRLAFNPNKADRDTLYKADVNPVVTFQGEGTYLFGDKTLLGRPSAFDRINVRRLFITLEKTISNAARASLFEFNDEFTRSQFIALVDPYLRSVQAGRGIFDYRLVCDERNNTPEVIDRNQFVGDIFIKPARSVNFIQLNFIALRTGVSFEEITGAV
jgi:phage tail sheath protein FI